nr:hypothetical protein [Pseudoalteromonas sp. H100]
MTISNTINTFIDLFTQADNAVYQAKSLGKNRTQLFENDNNF